MMGNTEIINERWKTICHVRLYLVLLLLKTTDGQPDQPVIQTNTGKVTGFKVEAADGKIVDAYFGIPFAKPPIGALRFRHPERIEPWEGIRQANVKPNSCHQVLYCLSEISASYVEFAVLECPLKRRLQRLSNLIACVPHGLLSRHDWMKSIYIINIYSDKWNII